VKTDMERDLIDYPTAIKNTKSRNRKISIIREFEQKHGSIPDSILHALGHSEWSRGWSDGVNDANED
jgi:hypothetical protein